MLEFQYGQDVAVSNDGSFTTIVDFKEIANGTGRKLVARNGQPAACP